MTQLTKPTLEKQIDALVEMRERFLVMAITYKVGDQFDGDFQSIEDAIESLRELAALSAQQEQEPTEPVAMEGYWWCPNCKAEIGAYHVTYQECHEDCGHKVEWITPVTAPLSGVQERIALQELRNIVNAKRFDVEVFDDDTAFADWAQSRARHAITRSADQVNAEPLKRTILQDANDEIKQRRADQPADAVVVPREYGIVKRDFIASPDTPQKRGALPTVTVVFPVEDWVARDRFADALINHERAAQEGK